MLLICMAKTETSNPSPPLPKSNGTFGGLSGAIVQALKIYDVDYKAIFSDIGLSTDIDKNFSNRISKEQLVTLLQDCVATTLDEALPLETGKQLHPTMFHHIGMSSLASDSLFDLFSRINRFRSLISDDFSVEVHREEDTTKIRVHEKVDTCFSETAPALLIKDAILAAILRAIRIVFDPDFVPNAIFTERNPSDVAKTKFDKYFGSPIHYKAVHTELEISNKLMDEKLPGANPELAKAYDEASLEQLVDLQKSNLTAKVESYIISDLIGCSASKEYVASLMHMSPRTLQKKLQKEGTSFKEILEGVRRRLAITLLRDESKTVGEVAVLLGYSNTANFSRAFKKWTGSYPANYIRTN